MTGVPSGLSTAPPLPTLVPNSQSPAFDAGLFAIKSPSMANPPLGTVRGAMPPGGGVARLGKARAEMTQIRSRARQKRGGCLCLERCVAIEFIAIFVAA